MIYSTAKLRIQLLTATLLCFAPAAFAQVQFEVEAPTGPLFGGYVYVSPYSAQIPANTGAPVPAICDDWADDVYLGQVWTAFATNLGSLTDSSGGSNLYYGANANPSLNQLSQRVEYDAAAILATGLLSLSNGPWNPSSTETQDAYSFAIWELFDGSNGAYGGPAAYLNSLGATPVGSNSTDGTYTATQVSSLATTLLNGAISQAKALTAGQQSSFSNVQIYSADCNGAVCSGTNRPQEFIVVSMPESSSPILLSVYMLSLGGVVFFFRRRAASATN